MSTSAVSRQSSAVSCCIRCGVPGLATSDNPDRSARPFRRAKRGYCTPCAVCAFFQEDSENGIGFAIPPDFDPNGLRLPHIQAQFARILTLGRSELAMEEIDWDQVIEKWNVKGVVA